MPGFNDWIDRLRNYGSRVYNDYASTGRQAAGMGDELAAKAQMMDQARMALGQDAVSPVSREAVAPAADVVTGLAPYEHVRPGYRPIGGAAALRQTLQGKPPNLR
jgi:hypothetical protein